MSVRRDEATLVSQSMVDLHNEEDPMQLSVIIPAYNERTTIEEVLRRVSAQQLDTKVIVVDDFSTDGTRQILETHAKDNVKVLFHSRNKGKGAAIRTGIKHVGTEFVIVQDADLEYDPEDFHRLLAAMKARKADVVYGSRLATPRPAMSLRHLLGNRVLTWATNLLYGSELTDMETCYKLFRARVLNEIELVSNRFNIEPELTAKLLKKGIKIHEVPISYVGRNFEDGKKISWKDFVSALWTLLKIRLID